MALTATASAIGEPWQAASGTGAQRLTFPEYRKKLEESPLHRRAIAAGGNLHEVREVAPEKLYPDLASLAKASDGVFLVHIIRNSCTVSPSGNDVITLYKALVLHDWKGMHLGRGIPHSYGTTLDFSVPGGLVGFDDKTRASLSIRGFKPLQDGGRYVVFLRFARGEERQVTPALRLAGESVQGAFGLENEEVHPVLALGAPATKYLKSRVPEFLTEVRSAVHDVPGVVDSAPPPAPEPANSAFLSPLHLQAVGMHLPSYMPSINRFVGYQLSLVFAGSQKERTIEWVSLPGERGLVPEETANRMPLAADFSLLEPPRPSYGGGMTDMRVYSHEWVIAASTADGEVRGLLVNGDPRIDGGEGHFYVRPKVSFNVAFPDDPQIARITFLWPIFGSGETYGQFHLKEIGHIDLKPKSPARPRARPQVPPFPGAEPRGAGSRSQIAPK
jgi:hypothetical protein